MANRPRSRWALWLESRSRPTSARVPRWTDPAAEPAPVVQRVGKELPIEPSIRRTEPGHAMTPRLRFSSPIVVGEGDQNHPAWATEIGDEGFHLNHLAVARAKHMRGFDVNAEDDPSLFPSIAHSGVEHRGMAQESLAE